ncbi:MULTISPECIES: hypothetical protein [Bacillus]|uniref:hypothetical protein n=1 Tax=Bacillus TaxID=1386 RepID=UPI0002DCB4AE|nr:MULTISPECIES: hypothetical protein [Bacillus]
MSVNVLDLPFPIQVIFWIVLTSVLLTQSTIIFLSAKKRGKNAWFWGFIGLLNIPSSAILYYFCVVYPDKKRERE